MNIGGGLKSLDTFSFAYCTNLKNVFIPSNIESIGQAAFLGCSTLEEVEISDGVESIGRVAFSKCSALSRIEIGREVRSIGASAFAETKIWQDSGDIVYADDWVVGCKNLNIGIDTNGQLLLEEGTAGIAEQVFYSCKKYLLEIIFPDSLKAIGTNAFRECTNLTVVVLGGETESIGEFAFYQCKNLTSVMCGNNVKLISIGPVCLCGMSELIHHRTAFDARNNRALCIL